MTLGGKIRAAILVWIVAEILILVALVRLIGFPAAVGLGFVGTAAGVLLLARAKRSAVEEMRAWMAGGQGARAADVSFRLIGGLLLIVPGFLSDVIALALMTPAVQRAVVRRFGDGFTPARGPRGPVDLDPSEWRADPTESLRRLRRGDEGPR